MPTNPTKEHPILFSSPMVLALLNTEVGSWPPKPIDSTKPTKGVTRRMSKQWLRAKKGTVLWVKSAFMRAISADGIVISIWDEHTKLHRFSNGALDIAATREMLGPEWKGKSSLLMPRWASRIRLECLEDAREERLHDIAENEALLEGIQVFDFPVPPNPPGQTQRMYGTIEYFPHTEVTAVKAYARLWNELHTKPGESWKDDPTVVVVGPFRRLQ